MNVREELKKIELAYGARDEGYKRYNPYDFFTKDYVWTVFSEQSAFLDSLNYVGYRMDSHARILDIGCGDGRWGSLLLNWLPDSSYFGVDLMQSRLQKGKTHFELNVLNASGSDLPFKNQAFDIVYHTTLFSSLPVQIWPVFLAEIQRVTKHGGHFLWFDVETDRMGISRTEVTSLITQAGFTLLKSSRRVLNFDFMVRLKKYHIPLFLRLLVSLFYRRYWVLNILVRNP